MTKLFMLVAAVLILGGSVKAQDSAQKQLLNCHAPASGARSWDSQPIENSAILPSAGGDTTSAAPTVQRHGLSVEARNDCPPVSNAPKAGDPNK